MEKILLSIIGFCLLASFTVDTKNITLECPKCKEESEKCINPLNDTYRKEVVVAADKLKAGKISKENYDEVCFAARSKRNKLLTECLDAYNKCCLKETKELMDKEE